MRNIIHPPFWVCVDFWNPIGASIIVNFFQFEDPSCIFRNLLIRWVCFPNLDFLRFRGKQEGFHANDGCQMSLKVSKAISIMKLNFLEL